MKLKMAVVGLLTILGTVFCTPDDSERCGDGFTWNAEEKSCDADNQETDQDTGTGEGGDAGDVDAPEGLGEPCTEGGGECDGFEASYCTANSFAPDGYCTIDVCAQAADDCPAGYVCCEMTVGDVTFCATPDDFGSMGGLCAQ